MEEKREANGPKVTQLLPEEKTAFASRPQSSKIGALSTPHMETQTCSNTDHAPSTEHTTEAAMNLSLYWRAVGQRRGGSGIQGLLREIKLVCHDATGSLNCDTTDMWGQIILCWREGLSCVL